MLGGNGNDTLNCFSQGELVSGDRFDGGAGVSLPGDVTVTSIEVFVYAG